MPSLGTGPVVVSSGMAPTLGANRTAELESGSPFCCCEGSSARPESVPHGPGRDPDWSDLALGFSGFNAKIQLVNPKVYFTPGHVFISYIPDAANKSSGGFEASIPPKRGLQRRMGSQPVSTTSELALPPARIQRLAWTHEGNITNSTTRYRESAQHEHD